MHPWLIPSGTLHKRIIGSAVLGADYWLLFVFLADLQPVVLISRCLWCILICHGKQQKYQTSELCCSVSYWMWWTNGFIAFNIFIPMFVPFINRYSTDYPAINCLISIALYWLVLTLTAFWSHCYCMRSVILTNNIFTLDVSPYWILLNDLSQLVLVRSLNRKNLQCAVADSLCNDSLHQADSTQFYLQLGSE